MLCKSLSTKLKDALNKSKHGLSLSQAEKLEWDDALIWQDTRRDYGEVRRVISLRKANNKEKKLYVSNN